MALHGQAAEEQREVSGSWVSATLHVDAKKIASAPAQSLGLCEACLPMMAWRKGNWPLTKPADSKVQASKSARAHQQ